MHRSIRMTRVALYSVLVGLLSAALACVPDEAPFDPVHEQRWLDSPVPFGAELASGQAVRLRVMAANITSGNEQTYDPGHGIRIFQGVRPDVVLIQEFSYGDDGEAALRTFVDQAFGAEFSYCREQLDQGGIPNGVISRHPIRACGEWRDPEAPNRDFAWAQIDLPGPTDLWAVSVHFHTASAGTRAIEAALVAQYVRAAVPPGDFLVVGGDLNTGSRGERALSNLAAIAVTAGPYPADHNGNEYTNLSRREPYDWVLASGDLHARQTAVLIGGSRFDHGLVVDTRVYRPIEELAPALVNDSKASGMQHMAVVRDFAIQVGDQAPDGGPVGGDQGDPGQAGDATTPDPGDADQAGDATTPGPGDADLAGDAAAPATDADQAGGPSGDHDAPAADQDWPAGDPGPQLIFINEVLANEPGSDPAGEFVELVNPSAFEQELDLWTLADERQVRHVFPPGTLLAGHGVLLVYGGAAGVPVGLTAQAASSGTLALSNTADTITLRDACGDLVDSVAWAAASADGVSINRAPDGQPGAPLVAHDSLAAAPRSPGTWADGRPIP